MRSQKEYRSQGAVFRITEAEILAMWKTAKEKVPYPFLGNRGSFCIAVFPHDDNR
jgi:hypothetical protein